MHISRLRTTSPAILSAVVAGFDDPHSNRPVALVDLLSATRHSRIGWELRARPSLRLRDALPLRRLCDGFLSGAPTSTWQHCRSRLWLSMTKQCLLCATPFLLTSGDDMVAHQKPTGSRRMHNALRDTLIQSLNLMFASLCHSTHMATKGATGSA